MSWENDEELIKNSKFVRFTEGLNKYTLANDGEKVRNSYGNAVVEFKTTDDKLLSIRPGPILRVLAEAKKEHGTLVGRTLEFTRTGTTKEDTKYTDIKVV